MSDPGATPPVGILALQGAVEPHERALDRCGASSLRVRTREDLDAVDHLIIPGGESTTLWHLLQHADLWEPVRSRGRDRSLAIFGTCAGAILCGRSEVGVDPPRLDLLDVAVERNAYGRQADSFIAAIELGPSIGGDPLEGVFIRAPRIREVPPGVEIIASHDGEPVAVSAGSILLATFHPELGTDPRLHQYFLSLPPSP